MSPLALQRMSVRMLYDWELTTSIYDAGVDPILDVHVSATAREVLTRPARELWRSDPYRQSRTVTALLRVFKSACAWALLRTPQPALTDFFASPVFHSSIEDRTSTVRAFGRWLEETFVGHAEVAALARLEGGLDDVRRRRASSPRRDAPRWSLSPDARVAQVPNGTSDLLHATIQRLDKHPISAAHAAVHGEWEGADLTLGAGAPETLLLQRDAEGGAQISRVSAPMYDLLAALSVDAPLNALAAVGAKHDASLEDLDELLRDLCEDGVVVCSNLAS